MALDLLFKNATVIDGSGADRRVADVGVRDGVITEIGRISESAAEPVGGVGDGSTRVFSSSTRRVGCWPVSKSGSPSRGGWSSSAVKTSLHCLQRTRLPRLFPPVL